VKPTVFWITGLPGAGKTTLAKSLVSLLQEMNVAVVWLDGDKLRAALGESTSFKVSDRLRLGHTYRNLATLCVEQGFTVVVSTVSLFHEIHQANRNTIESYLEIYLDSSLSDSQSDSRSHLRSLVGEDNPFANYEIPLYPDIVLRDSDLPRDQWSFELRRAIEEKFK
jgi:adenylylsulfate kinase